MTEKNLGGRPPHEPTEATRKQVESMAGFGIPAADISRTLDICETTLRKHYRDEIDLGAVKANSAIAQSLYKKALGDGSSAVTAAIFWAKTRMGWKETMINEHTGKDGGPIKTEDQGAKATLAYLISKGTAARSAGSDTSKADK